MTEVSLLGDQTIEAFLTSFKTLTLGAQAAKLKELVKETFGEHFDKPVEGVAKPRKELLIAMTEITLQGLCEKVASKITGGDFKSRAILTMGMAAEVADLQQQLAISRKVAVNC